MIKILKGDYDGNIQQLTAEFDELIDSTECSRELGAGNYGTVYKSCLQMNPCDSCIVLKVSKDDGLHTGSVKSFDAEFAAMQRIFQALSNSDQAGTTANATTLVPRPVKTFLVIQNTKYFPVLAMQYSQGLSLRAKLKDLSFTQDAALQGVLAQIVGLLYCLTRFFPEFQHMDLNTDNILLADPMLTRIGIQNLGMLSPRELGCPSVTILDFGLSTFRHADLHLHDDIEIDPKTKQEKRYPIPWYFDTSTLQAYKSYDFKLLVNNFSYFVETKTSLPIYSKFFTWVFTSVFISSYDPAALAAASPGDKQKAMYAFLLYFFVTPDMLGKKFYSQSIYFAADLTTPVGAVKDSPGTRVFADVLKACFGLGAAPSAANLQLLLDLAKASGVNYPMFRRFDWGHIITHPFIRSCYTAGIPQQAVYFPKSEDVTLMDEK